MRRLSGLLAAVPSAGVLGLVPASVAGATTSGQHGSPVVGNLVGLCVLGGLLAVLVLQLRKRRRNDLGPTFMASPAQRGVDEQPSRAPKRRRGGQPEEPFRGDRL